MALLRQAEVVKNYKVSRSTLHNWTNSGKITDRRTEGGHRRYDEDEMKQIFGERTEAPKLKQNLNDNILQVIQNSGIMTRQYIASRLGKQFNGDRDLYSSFGYIINPVYADYRAFFDRTGLATQIVEILPRDTWRKPPALIDGKERSDGTEIKSKFLNEFNKLADRLKLWSMFLQADILAGIGRYAVLLMGAPGDLSTPAVKGNVAYLAAYDEQQAMIQSWVLDKQDSNYGLPKIYTVSLNLYDSAAPTEANSIQVHYSRVLHITENKLGSRVYGRPRLQTVLNRLFDLEKVTGGSAEAVWLTIFKGFILSSREGSEMPTPGSEDDIALKESMTAFVNRLQRYLAVDNVDVKDLGVETISVKDTYDVLTTDLLGSIGIPKRIFFGSESGQLASTQDLQAYSGKIVSRQTNYAEPEILRPFIDWCIVHNVLPSPESGDYSIWWPELYEMTMMEKADVALKVGDGAFRATNGIPENVIATDEWRKIIDLPPMAFREPTPDSPENGIEVTPTGTIGNRPGKDVVHPTEGGK